MLLGRLWGVAGKPYASRMEPVQTTSLILGFVISVVVGYFVVRTAVYDALRKHTIWTEDRVARPDHYDPAKPFRGPVPPE